MRGGCWPARSQRALTSSTCARGRHEAGKGKRRRLHAQASAPRRPRTPAYARVHGSPSQVVHVARCTTIRCLVPSLTCRGGGQTFACVEGLDLSLGTLQLRRVIAIHRCYDGNKEFWLLRPVHVM
ncbi:hypothetical protein BDA96_01G165200 [Sorghum bicolor]|uniref:Uncharacterized protein n=2 Tax=Sorghum bicolor TaxID=4558 RepID=A0A921RZ18_SORBI|nr:hypothetical protein BDA96_01G165200 [Sorghum bicolor]KXG37956.1 hypothetical protein SORBI_3001G157000 [Sorghum bicolor]